jgi:hypothetical protein
MDPHKIGAAHSPGDGNRSNFRNVVFSEMLDNGQSSKRVILHVIYHQKPLELT